MWLKCDLDFSWYGMVIKNNNLTYRFRHFYATRFRVHGDIVAK
jgi:hypothetical protein